MTCLAEMTIVLAGGVGGDDFSVRAGERVGTTQEEFGQGAHGPGCFGAEGKWSGDSGESIWKRDVGHWIFLLLLSDLNWFRFGDDGDGLVSAALNLVARQREHEQARDQGRKGEELDGDRPIRAQRIEQTADDNGAGGAPNGIGSPGKSVEGGEALEPEVAAQQVGRDVALTAHAESDKARGDKARSQTIGYR